MLAGYGCFVQFSGTLRSVCPCGRDRRKWFALPPLFLLVMVLSASAAAPCRILLLHSYGREFAPFNAFSGNFRTELAKLSPGPVDFYEVLLESARFNDVKWEEAMVDYLASAYGGHPQSLVVCVGGPAARFVQQHRQQLFPTTPMLFAGVDERHLKAAVLTTNDTVVAVRHDPVLALENLLHVLPQTTNVAIVLGDSPLEQFWGAEMRRAFEPFTNRVALVWWNELSFAEMLKRCSVLPPRSAIFFAILSVDAAGVPHLEDRALNQLHAVANAPIFGLYDTQLGHGVVGGPLMRVGELSEDTARVALRVLNGEPPADIKTPVQLSGTPIFDARELARWSIPESILPPGSAVKYRETTLLDRYGWWAMAVIALGLLQAALIVVLLRNFVSLRRAARSLAEQQSRLQAILDTAAEGIITINELGMIESVNASATRIFGYSTAEMRGQNVSMLMPSPVREQHDQHLLNSRPGGNSRVIGVGREVCGRRKDGSEFPVELAVSEMRLDGRRMFTGCVRDITERKHAERAAREFGGRLLHAQEAERARLARELHDDITQRLACLAIDAGRIEAATDRAGNGERMRGVRDGLVRLSEDVHALSYKLHPSLLEDLGLTEALCAECERFGGQMELPVEVKVDALPAGIPFDAGLCLFRVLQEALRNAARHAQAPSVSVSLRACDGGLQLAVTDKGRGFEARQLAERHSLGLASMRERVRLLEGDFEIESAPGQGTTVLAWVPLKGEST